MSPEPKATCRAGRSRHPQGEGSLSSLVAWKMKKEPVFPLLVTFFVQRHSGSL